MIGCDVVSAETKFLFIFTVRCFPISGILLPHQTINIKKVETTAKFVLLVEKHTIYERLLEENILHRFHPCILVTVRLNAILKTIFICHEALPLFL